MQTYDIDIKDHSQPMLLSRPKKSEVRARGGDESPLLLVPELCTRTGVFSRGRGIEGGREEREREKKRERERERKRCGGGGGD